jgi:2-dehydropantoate 2-reductase
LVSAIRGEFVSIRSIAILGPGAVGGLLAGLFWRNHYRVTCIGREEAVFLIAHQGIQIESHTFGDFVAWPEASTRLDHKPDLLFITTKAPALEGALERVDSRKVSQTLVVPLLNGIEHMPVLRTRFGKNVVAASISRLEVMRKAPGHVAHLSDSACVELASDGDVDERRLSAVADALIDAGMPAAVLETEAGVLWGKLARLNAIACTTAAANETVGYVRSNASWRVHLDECVREAVAVAQLEGVDIDPQEEMNMIDGLRADLRTSLQRDVAAGRPSELDAIAGAVVRAGARHGLECPAVQHLMKIIESRVVDEIAETA